jgi:hypothetical protein
MDGELTGQLRDISGSRHFTCELCGRATTDLRRVIVSGRVDTGDSIEEVDACETCERLLSSETLPVSSVTATEQRLFPEE